MTTVAELQEKARNSNLLKKALGDAEPKQHFELDDPMLTVKINFKNANKDSRIAVDKLLWFLWRRKTDPVNELTKQRMTEWYESGDFAAIQTDIFPLIKLSDFCESETLALNVSHDLASRLAFDESRGVVHIGVTRINAIVSEGTDMNPESRRRLYLRPGDVVKKVIGGNKSAYLNSKELLDEFLAKNRDKILHFEIFRCESDLIESVEAPNLFTSMENAKSGRGFVGALDQLAYYDSWEGDLVRADKYNEEQVLTGYKDYVLRLEDVVSNSIPQVGSLTKFPDLNQSFIFQPVAVREDRDIWNKLPAEKRRFQPRITECIRPDFKNFLPADELAYFLYGAATILANDDNFVSVETQSSEEKVVVVGDLHGNIDDLARAFALNGGLPSKNSKVKFIFNGDLIDRGCNSLATLLLVVSLKMIFPHKIFINRGNHETVDLARSFRFLDELIALYSDDEAYALLACEYDRLWHSKDVAKFPAAPFEELFNSLSLGAVIDNEIFVVHGGIPNVDDAFKYLERVEKKNVTNTNNKNYQSAREEKLIAKTDGTYSRVSIIEKTSISDGEIKIRETPTTASIWSAHRDRTSGKTYYYNKVTQVSQWVAPDEWQQQGSNVDSVENSIEKECSSTPC